MKTSNNEKWCPFKQVAISNLTDNFLTEPQLFNLKQTLQFSVSKNISNILSNFIFYESFWYSLNIAQIYYIDKIRYITLNIYQAVLSFTNVLFLSDIHFAFAFSTWKSIKFSYT